MINPMQFAMNLLNKNSNSPIGKDLMQMIKSNDIQGIEKFGRNAMKQQGRDFDKEFADFKKQFGIK